MTNQTGAGTGILRLPHHWQRVLHNAGAYPEWTCFVCSNYTAATIKIPTLIYGAFLWHSNNCSKTCLDPIKKKGIGQYIFQIPWQLFYSATYIWWTKTDTGNIQWILHTNTDWQYMSTALKMCFHMILKDILQGNFATLTISFQF